MQMQSAKCKLKNEETLASPEFDILQFPSGTLH
jgi:hypothetical protein